VVSSGAAAQDLAQPGLRTPSVLVVPMEPRRNALEVTENPQASPASVTVIQKPELDRQVITTYGDVFRGVPGMWVNEYGQGGVAYGLSMRGFDDGNHGRDVAVFLDGVPLNVSASQHTNGYIDLAQLIPELVSRVEVTRGPFSPFAGNHAVGGSVQLYTDAAPVSSARAMVDSFGRYRVVPILATGAGPGKLLVAAEASDGSGYTDNSRVQRLNLFTRYVFPMLEGLGAVRLQAYDGDADAPGYLNRQAIENGTLRERSALSPGIGDTKSQQNLVFNYRSNDAEGRDGGGWLVNLYLVNDERNRWAAFAPPQIPPLTGNLSQEQDKLQQFGGEVRKTASFDTGGMPSQVSVGLQANQENLSAQNFATDQARQVLSRSVNRQIDTTTLAGYGQYQVRPVDPLKLTAGVRYDHFDTRIRAGADDSTVPADIRWTDGQWSPKLGAALRVFQAGDRQAELFANAARGLKAPWPFGELTATPDLRISPLTSYEAGIQGGTADNALFLRLSVWRTTQERESAFNPASLRLESFGSTKRDGVDVEAQWQVTEAVRVFGNFSQVDARSVTAPPGQQAISNVPDYVAALGVQSLHAFGPHHLDLSLVDLLIGPKPLNPDRSLETGSYHRITARAGYGHDSWRGATVFLSLIAYPGSYRNLNETSFDFGGFAATSPKAPYRVIAGVTIPF
jgi:outer membrane receptor protein involved in Fe transport